ncbi:cytochrome P450 [Amanita rubescens]|nr:cytochrome P450 [Amanita rubescens]
MDFVVPSLAIVLASTLAFVFLKPKRQELPYPPGPPPKPLIGNALDIPSKRPWVAYRNMCKEYNSDMIHLTAMNKHIVVLNKIKDAVNLFEKRSTVYSSRPTVPAIEIFGVDRITPVLPYGDEWRKHRRFYQESLRKDLIPSYNEICTEKVHQLLDQLLRSPGKFMEHGKWLTASLTMAVTFGYEYPPGKEDDHFISLAEETIDGLSSAFQPGSTLINVFPFLKYIPPWVPGAATQKSAARIKSVAHLYRNEPFESVERQMATGESMRPSVLGKILQRRVKKDGMYEDEEIIKDAVMTTYLGGVETLHASTMTFFRTMALYPAIQKRAQEEIDRVVGTERLPDFEDRISLPYIGALLREVFRWWCVAPQGLPHTATADDVYNGFYFPKGKSTSFMKRCSPVTDSAGTMVIPNLWSMMRDEEMYPDPESFKPERFFNDDGTLNGDTVPYAFGFGRRVCVGRHLAESVLWLFVACVLSTFNIAKARDEKGVEIEIDRDGYSDSVVSTSLPFDCSITPRSSRAENIIHDAILALQSNA